MILVIKSQPAMVVPSRRLQGAINLSHTGSSWRHYSCEAKPSRCNKLVNRLNIETNRVTVAMM